MLCWETTLAGFRIALTQHGKRKFSVQYGKQIDSGLSYESAAAKLGEAIMHALACEARLHNAED